MNTFNFFSCESPTSHTLFDLASVHLQRESRVQPLQDLSFQPEAVQRNIKVLKTFVKDTGRGDVQMLQEAKQKSIPKIPKTPEETQQPEKAC